MISAKIVLQIIYTHDWLDIAKIVVPNAVDYCRRHGYSWNIQCVSYPYNAFDKIKNIQTLFNSNEADYVVSMDCDTLITNHNHKIEDYILPTEDFFICKDYNGINAGCWTICISELFLNSSIYALMASCSQYIPSSMDFS